MAKRPKTDDFEIQVHRRPAQGWGASVPRNSISVDSDFISDRERLRTETVYQPSRSETTARRTGNLNYSSPMQGEFVERPVNVGRHVKDFMGRQVYRSAQKPFDQE